MELYLRGYRVRGLADPRHWLSPLGALFERFGSVKASPMAAARLLREREAVLLFPGGAREVRKGLTQGTHREFVEQSRFLVPPAAGAVLPFPVRCIQGNDKVFDVPSCDDDEPNS